MPSLAAESRIIAGRFALEQAAGSGGMGVVHRARDTRTGRAVAVKLLHAAWGADGAERFAREATLLAELRHPGIVEYLAHGGDEAGQPYLVMEWLEGEDLARRLSRGALSLPESSTLLRRVAEALAVAHDRGVVHRDLKPSNLFLRAGEVERVVLLDFGIARTKDASSRAITSTGVTLGTPAYMAPEQARGEREISPSGDVFSLGCVLFECLAGEPPFGSGQPMAVLAKVLFAEPPRVGLIRPELPGAVDALLARMLEKDPAARLPDAAAILGALDALDEASRQAAKASPAPAPLEIVEPEGGEQRLVSVLVATPEARPDRDPDATIAAELLGMGSPASRRALHGLARALEARGARVERLADGALVATLVDARQAATDRAAQAARCALLVKAQRPEAAIALSTGRGRIHGRLPVGEAFDRAALLLRDYADATKAPADEAPEPASILLDEVTAGLLDARFQISRTASGVYVLGGEEVTLDASRPLLGKPTPCVGREAELGMLELALSSCIDEATPRAVLVTGPPGAGKSRLFHELRRRVEGPGREGGDAVQVLVGRGDPMSAGSPYGLLGQVLRRLAGIRDGEDLEVQRAKLARRVAERLPAAEVGRVATFLGELCGVPFPDEEDVALGAARQEPRVMNDRITRAVLDLLRAECAARPLLLVLEDLHWGDALTLRLVEAALRDLDDCPLLVLAFARPEVEALISLSSTGAAWAGLWQPLPLHPLGRRAGERLAREVLGPGVPKETIAWIVEQSAGNALLLEELIRWEAEGRGAEPPGTVLALLQARIGWLEAGPRRALRAASVFGKTAWLGGLYALLGAEQEGEALERRVQVLLAEEILEERRESRFVGEREVRFRHALVRDAAYALITEGDRRAWHRAAARYLEARGEPDARASR
jgi:hypothetical protein